jgi:hypothetical protein
MTVTESPKGLVIVGATGMVGATRFAIRSIIPRWEL